ncbi:hypothetical protein DXG01_001564 [Tephrocybe rancida]|nr:hypothetical protein DXG01_001564 [Tephrocybe rancida]
MGQCTAYELSTSKPYRVFIVDTPGFDDTRLSDAEVLRRIAYWLAASYREGGRVSGVIFLHTITNTRFLPATSFRALEKMCGPQAFGKVVLVTTMWDRTTNEEGEQVEKELETVHWRKMITGGAGVGRTTRNNPVSAQNIVNYLLEKTDTRPLLIQEEIVEDMLYPSETTAGQFSVKRDRSFTNILADSDSPPAVQVQSITNAGIQLMDGLMVPSACIFLEGKVFLWDVPATLWTGWGTEHFEIFETVVPKPEILILGTGKSIAHVPATLRTYLNQLGIQLDVMDTRNACSTYNLLTEEGRRVAAALLPITPQSWNKVESPR